MLDVECRVFEYCSDVAEVPVDAKSAGRKVDAKEKPSLEKEGRFIPMKNQLSKKGPDNIFKGEYHTTADQI